MDFLERDFAGWRDAPGMHDATPIGHLVLIGIFRMIVVVHRMDNAKIQQQSVQHLNKHKIFIF